MSDQFKRVMVERNEAGEWIVTEEFPLEPKNSITFKQAPTREEWLKHRPSDDKAA